MTVFPSTLEFGRTLQQEKLIILSSGTETIPLWGSTSAILVKQPLVSLHLENVLLNVQGVMGPVFSVSFGATKFLITKDLVIFVIVEWNIPYSRGSCSLLHVDAFINKSCKLPNHANHGHKLFLLIFV